MVTSCSYDKISPVPNEFECNLIYTYDSHIKEIIDRNCSYTGCHNGASSAPGDFLTYSGLKGRISNRLFMDRVLNIRDMPPDYAEGPKALAENELIAITCWAEQGYPEN
jgi:hypothetical protein